MSFSAFLGNFRILVVTGYILNSLRTSDSEVIDIETSSTRTCEAFPHYPVSTGESSAVLLYNKVPFVCGGLFSNRTCNLYDQKTWQPTGALNDYRAISLMLPKSPFQNQAHLATIMGAKYSRTMEVFDGTSWSYIKPSMPVVMFAFCGVYINETTIFVMGGHAQNGHLSSSYYMNSDYREWTPGPAMVDNRSGHSCGRILTSQYSKIFSTIVVGGNGAAAQILSSVEILDDGSNSWRKGPDLPIKVVAASFVEDPRGGIIIVGGHLGSGATGNIYRLKHAGPDAQWEKLPQQSSLMRFWTAAVMIPNELANCT